MLETLRCTSHEKSEHLSLYNGPKVIDLGAGPARVNRFVGGSLARFTAVLLKPEGGLSMPAASGDRCTRAQPQMLPNKVRRTLWIGGVVASSALLLVRAQAEQPAATSYPSGILAAIDHRVPISPDAWPWVSIGRVNVSGGLGRRYCTGTLIGRVRC
jgi:hypothetical protein